MPYDAPFSLSEVEGHANLQKGAHPNHRMRPFQEAGRITRPVAYLPEWTKRLTIFSIRS